MIRACSRVDLPEPVLPAIRTCCEVPWPSVEVLQLGGAGLAERDVDARRGCRCVQQASSGGRDELERDLDAVGVAGRGADALEDLRVANSAAGGASSASGNRPKSGSSPGEPPVRSRSGSTQCGSQVLELEARRAAAASVSSGDQGVDAARARRWRRC